ncbi:Dynamin- protein 4C [Ancistrocladus abbreviatus]
MAKKGTAASRSSFMTDKVSTALVSISDAQPLSVQAPIIVSYNDRIRPLLDAVDRLRNLKVMKEGIQLPTIVVVGDQSSGKSSVLESLAGISLPRGQGICTRVPLIMRLQNHAALESELSLEYHGKVVHTDEAHVAEAIDSATREVAGNAKGISNLPLTLVVKKNGVPDLTMVDLPGITRVPVHGQPENIYEQIRDIITEYITPEESIILNVLSATVDFSTCESIRMSQTVDKTGLRTLAVVTKADKAPEGLLEKVTNDDVNIGLGYVCVGNRIGDESYEEARVEEWKLFENHPLLSKIDKSIVGIPVLAQKLVQIQATIISKCLPNIVNQINDKLSSYVSELNSMPQSFDSVAEALTAFMRILSTAKESLKKIFIRGEYNEYPDDKEMHCSARLAEMLNQYSDELQGRGEGENEPAFNFLVEEIQILEEAKGIGLPNFLPRTAFLTILQSKVKRISRTPVQFVDKVWGYVEGVVVSVLMQHTDSYPKLQYSTRRAAHNLIAKMREQSVDQVMEIVEMEKMTDYTCNPAYLATWNTLMLNQSKFMEIIENDCLPSVMTIKGYGQLEIGHLRQFKNVVQEAFDMKMRIIAYWKIVLMRLVDIVALHLLFSIQNLVNKEMEKEMINELMGPLGGGIERMLDESPSVAGKCERLKNSIKLLKESKEVVAEIMDKIAVNQE